MWEYKKRKLSGREWETFTLYHSSHRFPCSYENCYDNRNTQRSKNNVVKMIIVTEKGITWHI
jgi:hypothetical protein